MNETWRPVVGYEGLYEVSDLGNVRSLNYNGTGIIKNLKPQLLPSGYLQVSLYKKGRPKSAAVHRLVAKAFIENPSYLPVVNHKDENKTNNEACNLEWCTVKYNTNYGTSLRKRCKPLVAKDALGNVIHSFESTREAANAGFNLGHVSNCCLGRIKTHKGLYWEYVQEG